MKPERTEPAAETNRVWQYRLLRYVPNVVSGEFYNLAVLLYDADGVLVEARFARTFERISCHPLADAPLLEALCREFEELQQAGEGLDDRLAALEKRLVRSFVFSPPKTFLGGRAPEEIERLYRQLVADPPRLGAEREAAALRLQHSASGLEPGTRGYLLRETEAAFSALQLFALGVERNRVVRYGPDRATMVFDYGYRPNGHEAYVQALALKNDLEESMRLSFIKGRLAGAELNVVADTRLGDDTRELLKESEIRVWTEPQLGDLAQHVHAQLTQ